MKKKFILAAVLLTAAIGASAGIGWIGECGYQTIVPSQEFFVDEEDANEYYQSLNEIYCNSSSKEYTLVP